MKKLYCLILMLCLLLHGVIAFSQAIPAKSEILPNQKFTDSRPFVHATVMDDDTWCEVVWGWYPSYWEMVYDDGEADDYFIYANSGSMNANRFTPFGYPINVIGGRIYVGDGSFPGPFLGTSFQVLIYDDDGEDGLPGTALDSMTVTVNNYGWVEFDGMTANITEGDFYLAMKQTAPSPNAAPVGVDTDNPTYFRSYSHFQGAPGWVLSPLQDFMIRAWVDGYEEPSRDIDYYQLDRFSGFDPDGSPILGDTTLLDTTSNVYYNDTNWAGLEAGWYAYGLKTHYTSGEWSDYDVSNEVIHINYTFPPSCFYQADTANMPLIICPPHDLNGAIPNYFFGFNLYRDWGLIDFLPASTTSFAPAMEQPGIYLYELTAVYDLEPFGYPGETIESCALTSEYVMRIGYPLPFLEQWNLGTFETNNWTSDGSNWSVSGQYGNPFPAAQFTWDPILTDYQSSLTSFPFQADSMTEGKIYLDFDIKLGAVVPTGNELMFIQVWNWDSQVWATADTLSNIDGSFDWTSEHIDISSLAMGQVFRIRFSAQGENSINILSWFIDNIHVYRACNPPENLDAYLDQYGINLIWEKPAGIGFEDQWMHWDDGEVSSSIFGGYDWAVAARWTPDQLTDFEGAQLTHIAFVPGEGPATYKVRVWQGEYAANLLTDQEVISPVFGQWNYILLNTPVQIDITQELWVGYHINNDTGYPAGVDDGPAIDGYGNWYYFGHWETLTDVNPDLDFNWNIQAFIEPGAIPDSVAKYAIYRSDNGDPYFLRDFSDQNYYLDDSLGKGIWCYYVTALYIHEADTCESSSSNEACEFVGLNEKIPEFSLNIFPNPSKDFIRIESTEEIKFISLYNSYGKLMLQKKVDERQVEITVRDYPAGVYMIRVETGKEMISRKVLVMH